MTITLHETTAISIAGLPCTLSVYITSPIDPSKGHTLMAFINPLGVTQVQLASAIVYDGMLIPDGSIEDELDKQVALGSAEALLDLDAVLKRAEGVVKQLTVLFGGMRNVG